MCRSSGARFCLPFISLILVNVELVKSDLRLNAPSGCRYDQRLTKVAAEKIYKTCRSVDDNKRCSYHCAWLYGDASREGRCEVAEHRVTPDCNCYVCSYPAHDKTFSGKCTDGRPAVFASHTSNTVDRMGCILNHRSSVAKERCKHECEIFDARMVECGLRGCLCSPCPDKVTEMRTPKIRLVPTPNGRRNQFAPCSAEEVFLDDTPYGVAYGIDSFLCKAGVQHALVYCLDGCLKRGLLPKSCGKFSGCSCGFCEAKPACEPPQALITKPLVSSDAPSVHMSCLLTAPGADTRCKDACAVNGLFLLKCGSSSLTTNGGCLCGFCKYPEHLV